MSRYQPFSKRRRAHLPKGPLSFEPLSHQFRIQVSQAWLKVFGTPSHRRSSVRGTNVNTAWCVYSSVLKFLREEWGVPHLARNEFTADGKPKTGGCFGEADPHKELDAWFLHASEQSPDDHTTDRQIDVIEAMLREIARRSGEFGGMSDKAKALFETTNHRFSEHNLGYRFEYEAGFIVRLDSETTHEIVTQPALKLLRRPEFQNAEEEFLHAQLEYRSGHYEDAMVWAHKALESVMKIICTQHGWTLPQKPGKPNKQVINMNWSDLVKTGVEHQLISPQMLNNFSGLRSLLDGASTLRNKQAGHGQGAVPRVVPDFMAAYGMGLSASTIVFLVRADDDL